MQTFADRVSGAARLLIAPAALSSAFVGALLLLSPSDEYPALLLNSAPWIFAGAAVVLLSVVLFRAGPIILALAFVGASAPATVIAPEFASAMRDEPQDSEDEPTLTIVSINVWSSNHDTERFRDFIRAEQPDVIMVQEAFRHWKNALDGLAPEYELRAGCQYSHGCNAAILSRLPYAEPVLEPTGTIAAARLQLPSELGGGMFKIVSLHLQRRRTDDSHRSELAELRDLAPALGDRAILAGDLNATPWTQPLKDLDAAIPLERRSRALFSWPTPSRAFTRWRVRLPFPVVPIDHVYAGRDWRLVEIRHGPDIGSDHYPIVARFALRRRPRPYAANENEPS